MTLKIVFLTIFLTLLFDCAFSKGRIYGGYPIDITKAPYMVHLTMPIPNSGSVQYCGGSILRKNLILTAGHCTADETGGAHETSDYTVHVGTNWFSYGDTYQVKNVYVHPKYKGGGEYHFHHDIALLELSKNIIINERAQLVNLAHKNDRPAPGTDGIVSGWGTNPEHPDDDGLYQVHLNVISAESCYDNPPDKPQLEEFDKHEICAEAKDKNFCSGDSGGPFIDTTTNRQIGVVSYGSAASCTANKPSVFSRVTDNLDFINKIIKKTKTARCGG